jgi:hypothetical protein
MKKYLLYFSAVVLIAAFVVSCGKKKSQAYDPFAEYSEQFTKEDTAAVLDLVNQFTEYLKQKDIKSATEMIYYLDKDSIKELEGRDQARQAKTLLYVIGCHDYKLDRIIFKSDIDNEAKLDIILFEKPEGQNVPNKTSFYFRPVKYEGKWYLTTKDNISDSHSELRNQKPKVGDLEENEDED